MLNQNQGLLTFLTVLLAVAGLWVAGLYRQADLRAAHRRSSVRAHEVLEAAMDEAIHNLIHVALSYRAETYVQAPQLSIEQFSWLCTPDVRSFVGTDLARIADNVRRKHEAFHASDSSDLKEQEGHMAGFITNSLRFLIVGSRLHPGVGRAVLGEPGLQDIRRAAEGANSWVWYRTKRIGDKAPQLRSEEATVICWIDDAHVPGVTACPQLVRFRDMNHPAH
jgi:hypothetical protein